MKYIVQDSDGKKMFMEVVSSIPSLPEGMVVLGLADDLLTDVAEIESNVFIEQAINTARKFLADSDWQVMRHRDQLDAGVATSLTAEQFTQLLADRQTARNSI